VRWIAKHPHHRGEAYPLEELPLFDLRQDRVLVGGEECGERRRPGLRLAARLRRSVIPARIVGSAFRCSAPSARSMK
jgi:hypothetical protein